MTFPYIQSKAAVGPITWGYRGETTVDREPLTLWLGVPPPTDPHEFVLFTHGGRLHCRAVTWTRSYERRPPGAVVARCLGTWGGRYIA